MTLYQTELRSLPEEPAQTTEIPTKRKKSFGSALVSKQMNRSLTETIEAKQSGPRDAALYVRRDAQGQAERIPRYTDPFLTPPFSVTSC